MKTALTDPEGFLLSTRSSRGGRQFVAVKTTELAALERSTNRSLRALAKRIHKALEEGVAARVDAERRLRELAKLTRDFDRTRAGR